MQSIYLYSLAVNDHGSGLVGLDPVSHYRPNPPPELEQCVRKGTGVTVPLGEVELQNVPFLDNRLQ